MAVARIQNVRYTDIVNDLSKVNKLVSVEIKASLRALATQPGLFAEVNFASRAETLDELEFHILDRLDGLLAAGPSAALSRLRKQAVALQEMLEAIDRQLFRQLQAVIRARSYSPESLRALLEAYVGQATISSGATEATSYDSLDVLTDGLFLEPDARVEVEAREPEMVPYQKTPARIVVELATKITPGDIFYDLGSGLGQVPMLVRLLSGATAKGVEIEPAYCHYAQACADALHLTRVHFLNADARTVDYADGSAFFLFTPFTGRILQSVLEQLRLVAQRKPIKLFSYGPGTQALGQQPWLQRLNPAANHLYQLAEFESG